MEAVTEAPKAPSFQIDHMKTLEVNKQCDIGSLLLEDCQNYSDKSPHEIINLTKYNYCLLLKELFDLRRTQKAAQGEDGEVLEYTKPIFQVELPESKVILPREKPIPKPKPLTKWEKFRLEKGLPARQKRSRMIFDPILKDWVPRYGHNSVKKTQEKYEWVLPHKADGKNPFTKKREEK